MGVGVGEYAGVQNEQLNKLPLSIDSNFAVGGSNVSELYVTQTGLPSIIALNVAPVLNGTGSETTYDNGSRQSIKSLDNVLVNVELNDVNDELPVTDTVFGKFDGVGEGVWVTPGKL